VWTKQTANACVDPKNKGIKPSTVLLISGCQIFKFKIQDKLLYLHLEEGGGGGESRFSAAYTLDKT
jgi:hypothetical protein